LSKLRILRAAIPVLLLFALLLLVGCQTDSPQNTFAPKGYPADKQRDLFMLVMWPAVVILILVEGAIVVALWRFRRRRNSERPKQLHGNPRLELAWTIAPALLLASLAVPTLATIADLAENPGPNALQVDVIARQWSWEFRYPDLKDSKGQPISSLNELHIPVDRKIHASVVSNDIIHSFWIPRLGGKIDAVPGRTNHLTFSAYEADTYAGECAEFCGLGHALMKLTVVAQPQDEFDAWVRQKQAAVSSEPGGAVVAAVEAGHGN